MDIKTYNTEHARRITQVIDSFELENVSCDNDFSLEEETCINCNDFLECQLRNAISDFTSNLKDNLRLYL